MDKKEFLHKMAELGMQLMNKPKAKFNRNRICKPCYLDKNERVLMRESRDETISFCPECKETEGDTLPEDYEVCSVCNFDHEYDSENAGDQIKAAHEKENHGR